MTANASASDGACASPAAPAICHAVSAAKPQATRIQARTPTLLSHLNYETGFEISTRGASDSADGFDFDEQILAAYIGLQIQDMRRRAPGARQYGPDGW